MLINCAAYQDGRKLADIKPDEISDYVSRPDCFVWVALRDPEPGELATMKEEFDLHELAVEDAHHGHQRPKIEEYGDSLFVVLHTIEGTAEEIKVGEIDIFAGKTTSCRCAAIRNAGSRKCARAASASRHCCGTAPASCCTRSWTR